ncbi:MAG: glutamine amidotransferase [Xanthomonadaceae bacterium]|nr:glutamine amidotransferase [Xanthomonadaceae bacterium]MDE1964876.1 glutamine amidotransferase [Xanthomonadaceae bacterium]
MRREVLIVRTGEAPSSIRARHGDFPHWFRVATGLRAGAIRVVDVARGENLPAPRDVAGALITGSASMVTERAAWSERTAGWIRAAMDHGLPLLGVCYGHQLMAHALGGRVDYLPGGREMGTVPVRRVAAGDDDSVLAGLPETFLAHTTHEQSVLEAPSACRVWASSVRDPHQLLSYGSNALSMQFHPEFSAEIMRAYIRRKSHDLGREGADVRGLHRTVNPTPHARALLRRFVRQRLCRR